MPYTNTDSTTDFSANQIAHIDIQGVFTDRLRRALNLDDAGKRITQTKACLSQQMDLIRAGTHRSGSGVDTVTKITEMVDALIHLMCDQLEMRAKTADAFIAIVAVGGYGRIELCPSSDLDLLILTSEKVTSAEENQAESLVRDLWDFGFEAGTSVRSVSQCKAALSQDPETAISFLDERFLGGNFKRYRDFIKLIGKQRISWSVNHLITYLINGRINRIKQFGGLVQLLEPNLKEGNGGLRDVHTILWISRLKHNCRHLSDLVREGLLTPQEWEDMRIAYDFILQTRSFLHFLTGKKGDLLIFDVQDAVAAEFGFSQEAQQRAAEVFLKIFYGHNKAINRITEAFIARWIKKTNTQKLPAVLKKHPEFKAENGILRLKAQTGNPFNGNFPLMLSYFDLANQTGLAFGSRALRRIKQAMKLAVMNNLPAEQYIHQFLQLCKRPKRVGRMIRAMHEVGLLDLIIPPFHLIDRHVQHNIYHIYTTDEHSLTVVRQLAYLEQTTDANLAPLREANKQVDNRDVLILSCIFHDVGKGQNGDHSQIGADLIYNYMDRNGFEKSICEEGRLLVLYHQSMNEIAQRRNLEDLATICDLVDKVKTASTLHKLFVLTYCDVSSVHPDGWSDWKAALLSNLYYKTLDEMQTPEATQRKRRDRESMLNMSDEYGVNREVTAFHLDNMPKQYIISTPIPKIFDHIQLTQQLTHENILVKLKKHTPHLALTVISPDSSVLMLVLAGTLANMELSILNARIYTRFDGMAIDEFNLTTDSMAYINIPKTTEKIKENLKQNLKQSPEKLQKRFSHIAIPKEKQNPESALHVPLGIEFSNTLSENYSTIDISCHDQVGLMYVVSKVFKEMGIITHGATLSTEAAVAMDAFYVTNMDNQKIKDEALIEQIKARLTEVLL